MTLEEDTIFPEMLLNRRLILKGIHEQVLIVRHDHDNVWFLRLSRLDGEERNAAKEGSQRVVDNHGGQTYMVRQAVEAGKKSDKAVRVILCYL